jgi:D123
MIDSCKLCLLAAQVLLLLQSSDRIAHDICHAFDGCAFPPGTQPLVSATANVASATHLPAAAAAQPPDRQQEAATAADSGVGATPATLLPASDTVAEHHPGQHDAAAAPAMRPQHVLVLRAWRDLRPGREFRCFVRGREVIGEPLVVPLGS